MPRFGSNFPFVFGATLIALAIAFHGRRKLFPEVFEEQRRQTLEGRRRAQEIRVAVKEGMRKEKEKRGTD